MSEKTNVRIQDDLFRAVNADWLAENEIPADHGSWSLFTELREQAADQCLAILRETSVETAPLLALPFQAFLDEEAVEAAGTTPIEPLFTAIASATDKAELARVMGELAAKGVDVIIGLGIYPDDNNPSEYTTYIAQDGISLPDESMYREEKYAEIREAFVAHLERTLEAIGKGGRAEAEAIMRFETEVAKHHFTNVESRDTEKTNNPMTWADVFASAPELDLRAFLEPLNLDPQAAPKVNNGMPSFITGAAKVWAQTPLDVLQNWLTWQVVRAYAPYLSAQFVEANFDFYGRTLSGQPEMRSREKRAVTFVENSVGEELGRIYVEKHFPAEHKAAMDKLVHNLLDAYGDSIRQLDWMGDETKQRALEKLATFNPKIGHPTKWKDYSKLQLETGDSLVTIAQKVHEFHWQDRLAHLTQPVDRDEWMMTPQTVNAYYYPTLNEIVFPAAILQPPYFDINASEAANYGAIGAIIGHEIGHGFDDQGSQYGADGRISNWWTDADRAEFEKRTHALIEQYSAFSPAQLSDEYHVNGALTIGENIGDLGGLSIALKAWEKVVAAGAENPGTIQDFFRSWAICWRSKSRDELLIQLLAVDPHSPAEFRCNGVPRNMDAFYDAFDVNETDGMWLAPDKRVTIW